ncbi:MAG: NUDIX domain-containing protein [Chloroflexota bacterium]
MNTNDEFTLTKEEVISLRAGFKYCPRCRAEMVDKDVYGQVRRVCPDCRFVQFLDPKVGAAVMAVQNGKVVLIKRSMDPARGSWCMPGGFMEMYETPQETAIRECKEECGLDVEITALIDVYYYESYRGSGVLIIYKGNVTGGTLQAGDDADDAGLFGPDELPENIVFDSNVQTLAAWRAGDL